MVSVPTSTTHTASSENRGCASIPHTDTSPQGENRSIVPIQIASMDSPTPQPDPIRLLDLLQRTDNLANVVSKYPDPPAYAARIYILIQLLIGPIVVLDLAVVEDSL